MAYDGAAAAHVVGVAVGVGAEIEAGGDSGERSSGGQSQPAVDGLRLEFDLVGVGFRRHPLVERRYGRCEALQFVLHIRFLPMNSYLLLLFIYMIIMDDFNYPIIIEI